LLIGYGKWPLNYKDDQLESGRALHRISKVKDSSRVKDQGVGGSLHSYGFIAF